VRLPDPGGRTIGSARIVRALTADELAAPLSFSVSLRMRDFAGLEARLAAGGQVPFQEMEERYLPLRSDYARVASWLAAQGFTQTVPDRVHMTVFARGAVGAVARSLGVRFARVAAPDGDYTSAVSEPALPADLAPLVLCVGGLQPQNRLRHVGVAATPAPRDVVGSGVYVTPDNLVSAYNIPAGATGAGQTIAIVGEAPVQTSDLTTFWRTTGIAQVASNVTTIDVDGGPGANPDSSLVFETCLDVEWATAIAPAAQVRLYLAGNVLDCFQQILNDLPDYPGMTVVSSSYGASESMDGTGALQEYAQVTATFAAAGVSVLASSGDAGSNPDQGISAGDYLVSAPLGVSYPASDPNVTGVGGTTVQFTGSWDYSGEVVWNDIATSSSASGGGVSSYFAKPSWQAGGSVLAAQSMRCVPDVAAISTSNLTNVDLGGNYLPQNGPAPVLVFQGGTAGGALGTSLSCPVWAAVTALINQARATSGLGPIGLLNPHLYPLAGTSAFNDVTSGTNGAYSAGPGYDLCTGLGSPNVVNLLAELAGTAPPQRLANISSRATRAGTTRPSPAPRPSPPASGRRRPRTWRKPAPSRSRRAPPTRRWCSPCRSAATRSRSPAPARRPGSLWRRSTSSTPRLPRSLRTSPPGRSWEPRHRSRSRDLSWREASPRRSSSVASGPPSTPSGSPARWRSPRSGYTTSPTS